MKFSERPSLANWADWLVVTIIIIIIIIVNTILLHSIDCTVGGGRGFVNTVVKVKAIQELGLLRLLKIAYIFRVVYWGKWMELFSECGSHAIDICFVTCPWYGWKLGNMICYTQDTRSSMNQYESFSTLVIVIDSIVYNIILGFR